MTEWDATGGSGFIDRGVTKYQLLQLADCNEGGELGDLDASVSGCFHPFMSQQEHSWPPGTH